MGSIIFLIACFLGTGYATMECYTCNTTYYTERNDDVCKGIETIGVCNDPSLCLSATLQIKEGTYTAIKSCHIPQNGEECANFLKNLRVIYQNPKLDFYKNQCKTCDKKNCNKSAASMAASMVPTFLVLIISYVLSKLVL